MLGNLVTLPVLLALAAPDVAATLRSLDLEVFPAVERGDLAEMVGRDIERRRLLAIRRENDAWRAVRTREDWERFRDARIDALRRSLGTFPAAGEAPRSRVTRVDEGDGYRIENLLFESRPGLVVTANLYLPARTSSPAPAVVFAHSHHAPKTQGELQDMGVTWARNGWLVLVVDQLGHGERRQHPFVRADQHPGMRLGRQDYYFRYNVSLALHLVGESLMGWMAHDLMRGIDLLLARGDVDPARIILVGAVAGGGDPAGVTAALDGRVAAVAPFNFGGPQPDYAIPANAEEEFYYFGVAYWEMTRCLRLGGRDGFAHWTITGSVAPRRLIHAHEFSWNVARDPVWPRLEKVFGFYDARENLGFATGRGELRGDPPESTHCTNVGPHHRGQLYPYLERWFGMRPPPEESSERRSADDLRAWTVEASADFPARPVHELARALAEERLDAARRVRALLAVDERRAALREEWRRLLGPSEPHADPEVLAARSQTSGGVVLEKVALAVEPGIRVPLVLLRAEATPERAPAVVVIARGGKDAVRDERAAEIAELLAGGVRVCLADLRGSGESGTGGGSGPRSTATSLSCREQVLGGTLPGLRLRDLRAVLRYLRARADGGTTYALWGESLAEVNPPECSPVVPHGVDNPNRDAEPTPGLLALLGALFEDDVAAVLARGTPASYRSLLESPFLYVPHDAVLPGMLAASDVTDIVAALAPRAVRFERAVDGLNRAVDAGSVREELATALAAYRDAGSEERLAIAPSGDGASTTAWLIAALERAARERAAGAGSARALEDDSRAGSRGEAVLARAEARAAEILARVERAEDAATLARLAPRLRRSLRHAIGIDRLPPPAPANITPVGVLERGDHVVEKLVWETFPGVSVPVHIYRPAEARGRLPAVLHVPGHWWDDSKARPSFQALDINLARLGFVVLTYDPIGQGERGVSFRDHRRTPSLLVGVSQQGIVAHESRCALSYLRSRDDVDPERIGVTGASGGGYNTWIMAGIDEDIACAVPVVGTSEFLEQIRVCRPLDWYRAKEHCHYVAGLLRFANNHELLALAAPRPVLVVAAAGDESFPLPGIRRVVEYGRGLYAALDAAERFSYFEDHDAGHGYQELKREAAYGFFRRHLQGEGSGDPIPEPPTTTLPPDAVELRCFPPGENRAAGPGIIAWIRAEATALERERAPLDPSGARAALADVLGIDPSGARTTLAGTARASDTTAVESTDSTGSTDTPIAGGAREEMITFRSFDGLELRASVIAPAGEWAGGAVLAADGGRHALAESPAVEELVRAGQAVCLVDVRGLGELAVDQPGWLFAVHLLAGENLAGQQALDLLAAWRTLGARAKLRGKPLGLYGSGPNAALAALYAAALEPGVAWLASDGGFLSYRDWIERPAALAASFRLVPSRQEAWDGIDREIPAALFPFGALLRFDLPDLYHALAPRPVLVARPIDGDWNPRSASATRVTLESAVAATLTIAAGDAAAEQIAAWLRERE